MEITLSATAAYKQRIAAIKPILKNWRGWKTLFLSIYKEYDNNEGINALNRVLMLRSADVIITEKLETFITQNKPSDESKS
jgi:hypothetical protein